MPILIILVGIVTLTRLLHSLKAKSSILTILLERIILHFGDVHNSQHLTAPVLLQVTGDGADTGNVTGTGTGSNV